MRVLKRAEQGECCYFETRMRLLKTQLVHLLHWIFQISPLLLTHGPLEEKSQCSSKLLQFFVAPQKNFAKVCSHFQAFQSQVCEVTQEPSAGVRNLMGELSLWITLRVIPPTLPGESVDSPSLEGSKARLDEVWSTLI